MVRLIVFDLDLTLWHCRPLLWCDQLTPPIRRQGHRVEASCGTRVRLYDEVPELLAELADDAYLLALASRTSAPAIARELLTHFDIARHFAHEEIYPGDKKRHFHALHQATAVPYPEMLFFDDEPRNIESVGELGVDARLVTHGLNRSLLASALS
ncbi:MAG: magnesium-dependent phosphatase-1 [Verrucomicrobiota bacterium JB023]|nr:magnesium-dependent phosphatase-1 [Verrucomicrobiota bacterium JB023]